MVLRRKSGVKRASMCSPEDFYSGRAAQSCRRIMRDRTLQAKTKWCSAFRAQRVYAYAKLREGAGSAPFLQILSHKLFQEHIVGTLNVNGRQVNVNVEDEM